MSWPAGRESSVARGDYLITVTADAFSQIAEARTDNNSASVHVTVRDARVDIVESAE